MSHLLNNDEVPKKKRKKPDLPIVQVKTTADYQRMKLERLMANPDKKIVIPARPKDKNLPGPPEFVRNIMGSSAGAGSGEFHVYRHLRRREYARQKAIQDNAKVEGIEENFRKKIEDNQKLAELKTAKNRAKRQKKKMKQLKKKKAKTNVNKKEGSDSSSSESSSSSEDEKEPETGAIKYDTNDKNNKEKEEEIKQSNNNTTSDNNKQNSTSTTETQQQQSKSTD